MSNVEDTSDDPLISIHNLYSSTNAIALINKDG